MDQMNIDSRISFNDPFRPQILKVNDKYKVPLICMKPGQSIPPHASGEGVFYFVRGKGKMTVDNEVREVSAGDMVFVQKGAVRGIEAVEELIAFATHVM